ncbi:hypothetical protein ARMGADRAFT_1077777 [Armillaria gallica]|uniref:Uncharacterized protein n=1 Tax=Armillaria gallica TaxID=47427 RepID=A0A2H3DIG7_ARMGA|nr:hypothetical protein ARMGADRAFT_1077777 [Armillaria gallica]
MPAIGTITTRRIVVVVLAAFFTAAAILFLIVLCLITYDTAGIEEAEEEATNMHMTPKEQLIFYTVTILFLIRFSLNQIEQILDLIVYEPDPATDPDPGRHSTFQQPRHPPHRAAPLRIPGAPTILPKEITALGIALAAITTTVTASLLTLVYSRELRTLLTRLGVLLPTTRFQRYVQPEPGPRLARPSPTEYEPTPNAARNAQRERHRPQSIPPVDQRNVRVETDPWAGWEDARPDQDPDYPAIGRWIGEAIQPLLDVQWDQPVELLFHDLHPDFELPDAPLELNPIPSYEIRDPRKLPRAHPRPRNLGLRNSIPFPTTTGPRSGPFTFSFGAGLPEDPDSDSDTNEPGTSQRRQRISDPSPEPDPFADPHPNRPDDDPFNPRGSDYEWPELQEVDRVILGPHRSAAWEIRRRDLEQRLKWPHSEEPRVRMDFYLAVESGNPLMGEQTTTHLAARLHANQTRQLYPPSAGHRIPNARPRTTSAQILLEADLCTLAILHEEWAREQGF